MNIAKKKDIVKTCTRGAKAGELPKEPRASQGSMFRKLFLYVRDIASAKCPSGLQSTKVLLNTSVDVRRLTKCGYMDAGTSGPITLQVMWVRWRRRVIGFKNTGGQFGKRSLGCAIGLI